VEHALVLGEGRVHACGPEGVVELFSLVDPDLVIAEVRSDHAVRGSDRRYRSEYIQFLCFDDDGLICEWREFSNPDAYRRAFAD
jgi:ketosteroid isomerase-like protein